MNVDRHCRLPGVPVMAHLFTLNSNLSSCCAIGALVTGLLHAIGLTRLWHRGEVGRGVNLPQLVFFVLGWSAAILLAITGMHVLGRQVFVMPMVEHEILMVVAAPLLILARPLPILLWGLPPGEQAG